MKLKTLFIILLFLTACVAQAQINPSNKKELKQYFKNNIENLDPIEGVYDVNIEGNGENAFTSFPTESTNETFEIYKDLSGDYKIFEDENVTIKRIGNSSFYNYNKVWPKSEATISKRIELIDDAVFNVKWSIPDRELRYSLGSRYQAGFKINYAFSFAKTFPDPSVYAEKKKAEKWSATGFSINGGYVVTNYHVVKDANKIIVQGVNGEFAIKHSAKVECIDNNNDLAILKLQDIEPRDIPYNLKFSVSDVGESIWVLGYPLTATMGDEIKLTTGVISAKSGFESNISQYQISAPLQPGNSGGPVFDSKGNVIGIVCSQHEGTENVGYAIKASCLRNLIESSLSGDVIPMENKISNQSLPNQIKTVQNFVYYIECSR